MTQWDAVICNERIGRNVMGCFFMGYVRLTYERKASVAFTTPLIVISFYCSIGGNHDRPSQLASTYKVKRHFFRHGRRTAPKCCTHVRIETRLALT